MLIGLAVAGVVAYCNATSSAALAAQYPESGGSYVYGRERLGHWWGFTAGWGFVIVALAAVLVGIFGGGQLATGHLDSAEQWTSGGVLGILQAAGLLFFAFAGYARIATLGEEVRDPRRIIPRAIPVALAMALGLYAVVGIGALLTLGPARLAASTAPLAEATASGHLAGLAAAAGVGAAVASLGALLALITGIGRTTLAMARNRDLPGWLSAVHPHRTAPKSWSASWCVHWR